MQHRQNLFCPGQPILRQSTPPKLNFHIPKLNVQHPVLQHKQWSDTLLFCRRPEIGSLAHASNGGGNHGEDTERGQGGARGAGALGAHSPSILLGIYRKAQDGGHAHTALLLQLRVSLSAVLVPMLVGQDAEGCQQH